MVSLETWCDFFIIIIFKYVFKGAKKSKIPHGSPSGQKHAKFID